MEPSASGQLQETTARLGTERLGKLLLRLGLPSVASMLTMSLYHLADTFWLGQLSYQAIAAVTVTFPFFILIIAVGDGTGVGANALVSRRFGEGNIEASNRVAGQIFPLSAVLGALLVIVSLALAGPLAGLLGATSDIRGQVVDYIRFFSLGAPFLLFRLMSQNVFQASGDAIKPMVFTVIGAVVNVALDPFLIFGWGPFPAMGVGGAGLATSIGGGIGAVLSFYYLVSGRSAYRIKLHHLKPDFGMIGQIYRVGLPSMMMELTETIVFTLFNRVVAGFGSTALAALGLAIRISDMAFMPIIGVSHGLLPIVGFCFGARLWKRLWAAVRLATLSAVVMLAVATVIFEVFAPQLVSIFNDDPELLAMAVPGMRIFMAGLVLVGPAIVFTTTFQGLSKGWTASILSLGREIVFFVPALYILAHFFDLNGVWWSLPLTDTLSAGLAGAWLYREYRHQKRSGIWDEPPVPRPIIEPTPGPVPHGRPPLD